MPGLGLTRAQWCRGRRPGWQRANPSDVWCSTCGRSPNAHGLPEVILTGQWSVYAKDQSTGTLAPG